MKCSKCGEDFYLGDSMFFDGGVPMCEDCFRSWVCDLLDTSPKLLGERLGLDVEVSDGFT